MIKQTNREEKEMKTKLEMAHEYLIKLIEIAPNESTKGELVSVAWNYADLMQAEEDKRSVEEVLKKHKAIRKVPNEVDTFCRKEGQRLEDAKRFIESYKLVESCGGLEKAKKMLLIEQSKPYYYYSDEVVNSLKQAILDMESCL